MKKQKKKSRNNNFDKLFGLKNINLSQQQLRNRWIVATTILFIILIILLVLIILYFSGKVSILGIPRFGKININNDKNSGSNINNNDMKEHINKYNNYDYEKFYQEQISKPKENEEVAYIYVSGVDKPIKVKLFEEEVPEIVSQFKEFVNKGYYNNKEIYPDKGKVLRTSTFDSRIQWGTGDIVCCSNNIPDSLLKQITAWDSLEVKTNKVLPYNGALCANGVVLDNKVLSADILIMNMNEKNRTDLSTYNIPNKLKNLFKKYGGDPIYISDISYKAEYTNINIHANLLDYLKHPTFGHIYEGIEIVDRIINSIKPYTINKIEIVKYKE